jgi:hypothetical protein
MNQPNFDYTKPNNLLYYIDNLFLMIFAAVVTTSRAAANTLYGDYCILKTIKRTIKSCLWHCCCYCFTLDLAGRPECLNELYEEALTINNECNGSITMSDIQKMKKLDSFVKESLRNSDNLCKNI